MLLQLNSIMYICRSFLNAISLLVSKETCVYMYKSNRKIYAYMYYLYFFCRQFIGSVWLCISQLTIQVKILLLLLSLPRVYLLGLFNIYRVFANSFSPFNSFRGNYLIYEVKITIMRKLYENFHILHFQKRMVFAETIAEIRYQADLIN